MNKSIISVLASEDVLGLACVYSDLDGAKEYTFKTLNKNIKEGSLVVVQAASSDVNKTYRLAIVRAKRYVTIDVSSGHDYKWVVDVIDTERHAKVLEAERGLIDKFTDAEVTHKRKQMREALGLDNLLGEDSTFKLLSKD